MHKKMSTNNLFIVKVRIQHKAGISVNYGLHNHHQALKSVIVTDEFCTVTLVFALAQSLRQLSTTLSQ